MEAYLETVAREHIAIAVDAFTIGRNDDSDLPLVSDPKVSGLHAVIHRYRGGWSVQDLDSRNGTFVNGRRVIGERQLRPLDEIGVGDTRLVFRAPASTAFTVTLTSGKPPVVTPAERRVLIELCRPLVGGAPFPQPASVAEIAQNLVVGEETVKWHLKNLIAKFDIEETGGSRRILLANEALRRRAVSLAELQTPQR